jgi:hypothetical protein
VFVERGEGIFETRLVEAGWRLADRVEIIKGLEPENGLWSLAIS